MARKFLEKKIEPRKVQPVPPVTTGRGFLTPNLRGAGGEVMSPDSRTYNREGYLNDLFRRAGRPDLMRDAAPPIAFGDFGEQWLAAQLPTDAARYRQAKADAEETAKRQLQFISEGRPDFGKPTYADRLFSKQLPSWMFLDQKRPPMTVGEGLETLNRNVLEPASMMTIGAGTTGFTEGLRMLKPATRVATGNVGRGVNESVIPALKEFNANEAGFAKIPGGKGAGKVPDNLPKTELPKEPWQMTRREYRDAVLEKDPLQIVNLQPHWMPIHEKTIRQALSEGKPVPEFVLADYPDLAKQNFERKFAEAYQTGRPTTEKAKTALGENIASTAKKPTLSTAEAKKIAKMSDSELAAYNAKSVPAPPPVAKPAGEAKGVGKPRELVLWGRKGNEPYIKLTDNTSAAEMARRKKDGWDVLRYGKGDDPNALPKGESVVPKAEVPPAISKPTKVKTDGGYVQDAKDNGWWDSADDLQAYLNDVLYDANGVRSMASKYPSSRNMADVREIESDIITLENRIGELRSQSPKVPIARPVPPAISKEPTPVPPKAAESVVTPAEPVKPAVDASGAGGKPPVEPPKVATGAPEPPKEPNRLNKQGEDIAKKLNVKYDGIQEAIGGQPERMTFTDRITGSTVYAVNEADAVAKFAASRKQFKKGYLNKVGAINEQQAKVNPKVTATQTPVERVRDFYKAKIADMEASAQDRIASLQDWNSYKADEQARVKQILTDYVKEKLPLAERGKLITAVKNVKTQAQLDEVLKRVDELAEASNRKMLRTKIEKEVRRTAVRKDNGIVKGRFGGEMQAEIDAFKQNAKLSRDEAQTRIVANQTAYDEGKMTFEDMARANDRLQYAGMKDMTASELQDALDYIQTLKTVGRTERQAQLAKFQEEMATAKADVIEVVTGGKPVEPGVVKEYRGLKAMWHKIENGQVALTDFLDQLSGSNKSKPYQSKLNRFVDDRVTKSYNAEQNGLVAAQETILDNFKRTFNVTETRQLNTVLRKISNEKVNLGTFTNTDGKAVKLDLTKGQMMDAYNLMKAPENLPTFTTGNKFTPEMQSAIQNSLSVEEKAWADWQRTYLADYWQSINDVYEPLYGVKLGRNENYWPRHRDVEVSDVPEHILVQQDYNHFASVTNGSLKARVDSKIPFKFQDANSKLINHVTQMEHFKAWANTTRDLRSLFMSTDVRNAISQYHGKDVLGKINDYINVMARGGIEKAKRIDVLDKLRGNVAVSVLGVKPMTAVKQPTALLAYATDMPYRDFVTGVGDYLKNPVANYKTLYEKSAGLRARYRVGQYERDLKVGVQGGVIKNISGKANWKEHQLGLIQIGDKFGTVPGMWAKYKSALKSGLSDADAILEAEKLTNRTQNTSQLFTQSTIQHGGSWARLATMFQDQPNKYFRLINSKARNLINGRENPAKAIADMALLWVVIPSIFQWMSDGFQFKKDRQARAVALGPVNNLLIFGQMAQSGVGWVEKAAGLSDEAYPYQVSPVLQIADDVQAALAKAGQLIKAGRDPYKDISADDVIDMMEYLAKAGGMATGVPTPYGVQIEKALRGEDGKRDWRELLWSRWALKQDEPAWPPPKSKSPNLPSTTVPSIEPATPRPLRIRELTGAR